MSIKESGASVHRFDHLMAIVCIVASSIALTISAGSIWTMVVSIPLIIFFPGYYIQRILLRCYVIELIEIMMVSMAISGIMSLVAYLAITQWAGMQTYLFYVLMIITTLSALIPSFFFNRVSGRLNDGQSSFISFVKGMKPREKARFVTAIALAAVIVIAGTLVLIQPQSQRFSEFYVLGPDGTAQTIPRYLITGIEKEMVVGIANHEGRTIQYTVEIWQVDFTNDNMAITVHKMYFVDSWNVTLDSRAVDLNSQYVPQYERVVGLNITHPGNYSLLFILYPDVSAPLPEHPIDKNKDYSTSVNATSRVLDCVNKKIQFLQVNVHVQASESVLVINDSVTPPSGPTFFKVNDSLCLNMSVINREGRDVNYCLEIWLVNFTNVDMAVTVHEMYYLMSHKFTLNYSEGVNGSATHVVNTKIRLKYPGNYSVFFLLYIDEEDPLPDSPMIPDHNYAFTDTSWRIVRCVNHEVQYYQLEVVVSE